MYCNIPPICTFRVVQFFQGLLLCVFSFILNFVKSLMNPKRAKLSCGDRISELPAHIRQHILSFLSTEDAIRTSTLSTTWRDDWLSIPCLDFGEDFFNERHRRYVEQTRHPSLVTDVKSTPEYKHLRLVSLSIARRTTRIQKLQLFVPDTQHPFIQHELPSYVRNNSVIDEIELGLLFGHIPKWMLTSKLITRLSLYGCDLSTTNFDGIILPALLKLDMINLNLDQPMLDCVIAGCPAIEKLYIFNINCVRSFESMKISRLPKLKELIVRENNDLDIIEIDAQNIASLSFVPGKDFNFYSEPILSASCQSLTYLELCFWAPRNYWFSLHKAQLSHLKEFNIYKCSNNVLARIKDFGISLQILSIAGRGDLNYAEIYSCRKLKELRVSGYKVSSEWLDRHLTQLASLQCFELANCQMEKSFTILQKVIPTVKITNCKSCRS